LDNVLKAFLIKNNNKLQNVNNYCLDFCESSLCQEKNQGKIEQSETSTVKLQALTEKGTCPRALRYVAKANIIPDEEFKTEVHSIKREAKQKLVGAVTKFHCRLVERSNDRLRRAKSDKSRSKRDTHEA